jgi:protein-glutamine gamma-glutamyltransferase
VKEYPLLILPALFLWGYSSDNIAISVIFALLIEGHRLVNFRLELKEKDFNYISMISTLTAAGYIIFYINSKRELGIISALIQFLPVMLFPLNLFFLYSTSSFVNAKKLFLLFTTNKYSVTHAYIRFFRPDFLYFAAVILASNVKSGLIIFSSSILIAAPVLFRLRSKHIRPYKFFVLLVSLTAVSILIQYAALGSANKLRDFLTDLYMKRFFTERDRSVKIGNIGELKDDFKIEIRAELFSGNRYGVLIRDRIYNSYRGGRWTERETANYDLKPTGISFGGQQCDSVRIFLFSSGRTDHVRMPFGTFDLYGLETSKARLSSTGNIRLAYTQYLLDYKAYSHPDSAGYMRTGYDEADTAFDIKDSVYTDPIIDSLGLRQLDQREIYSALRNYFIRNYRYSLDYTEWPDKEKLGRFVKIKEGHCELFASLSALIFRRLGYPSRYVTGYLLTEYSSLEKKMIGRTKDRHAWTLVHDKNGWKELDPTPPDISGSRTLPGIFDRIYDYFSYIYYEAFMLKKENNDIYRDILLYSLIPLGLFLFFRILKDARPKKDISASKLIYLYKKSDELEMIEKRLISEGFAPENETVGSWFDRIRTEFKDMSDLKIIRELYYKRRYGRKELSINESEELKKKTDKLSVKD